MPASPSVSPPLYASLTVVQSVRSFPRPDGNGVIHLPDGHSYYITDMIDLGGLRIVCDGVAAFVGTSSETAGLTSTGLTGQPLISTAYTLPMQNLKIHDAEVGVRCASDGTAALDWKAVNFIDCGISAQIDNVANFVMESSVSIGGGLEFDNGVGTIAIETCLIQPASGKTGVLVPSTAGVTRRCRTIYTAVVAVPGSTAYDVDPDGIANNETFILDTVSFAGGGTYLADADAESIKSLFSGCVGIVNSSTVGHYYMASNATVTTISTQGTPVKAAGATLSGPLVAKFSQATANRATYTGNTASSFQVSVSAALASGNNNVVAIYVAKNGVVIGSSVNRATANSGGRAESISTYGVAELSPGDYVEAWIANDSGTTNITATDLQVIIRPLT